MNFEECILESNLNIHTVVELMDKGRVAKAKV